MGDLAILGGRPVVEGGMKPFNRIGEAEKAAVMAVLDSGDLSGFMGSNNPGFFGGTYVRRLEEAWAECFGCRHAISVNSNTSGLIAAMGAVGISPGDEVIVPPMTMSATVIAPIIYGGLPVFVDVEDETFCLDVDKVRAAVTPWTRVILAVNLFGHPARLHELRKLADEKNLYLVEDNAQGPLASEAGRMAGTIGHIGVFSLNRHKHIQTGEGGICTTDDDNLAQRLQMIRNHGQNLIEAVGVTDLTNMIGMNLRLTEISAAVGLAQLDRADDIVTERQGQAEFLSHGIAGLDGLTAPAVRDGCRHVYYVWCPKYDRESVGASRGLFTKALIAEGVPLNEGYCPPLYNLPVFQKHKAIGRDGWPFTEASPRYSPGLCPVAERLWASDLLEFGNCTYAPTPEQRRQIVDAFHKVFEQREALRDLEWKQGDVH